MKKIKDAYLKIYSLLAFGLAVIGILLLLSENNIFSTNIIGLSVQICMIVLMIWARITFGIRSFHASANTTKGELVTTGPYRYLRHPIYAAVIYFVWAAIIFQPNYKLFVAVLCVSIGLIIRMIIEEFFLMKSYANYEAYTKRTVRFIPFLF